MKILLAHNRYQNRGGEDSVAAAEMELLREYGHEVIVYERDNDELRNQGLMSTMASGVGTVWARESYRSLRQLLSREKPDVAHFHNTFPLISASAYYACASANVPVVQTLHNFRLLCPGGNFLREERVCESCLGRAIPWPGIVHRCYRDSLAATGAAAAMITTHRAIGTWRRKVHSYIALTEFARRKFISGGLPAERISVKPNFTMRGMGLVPGSKSYALFVGRLSEEKGVSLLLRAWRCLEPKIPLKIVGEGPLLEVLGGAFEERCNGQVEFLGWCERSKIKQLAAGARFLLTPSICYESFPSSIVEAFEAGLPVIASRLGSMAEIVEDGVTGLHFEAGNAADLAQKVRWAWEHPEEMQQMGRAARAEYEAKYTPERNYQMLMEIYERAIAGSN